MRRTLILLALPAMLSTLAFAESWSGTLLDSSCYDRQAQAPNSDAAKAASACMATSQTSSFAIETAGKVYKLDSAGNSKASTAFKNRAERSAPEKGAVAAKTMATVEGTESGGVIKVDRIDIQ